MDDSEDSYNDGETTNEDKNGNEKNPGLSQDTSGPSKRIVHEDPNGNQVNLSGQEYINFKVKICDEGENDEEGNVKKKEGRGNRSSGVYVTLHGSHDHMLGRRKET